MTPELIALVVIAGCTVLTLLACVAALLTVSQVASLRSVIEALGSLVTDLGTHNTMLREELRQWQLRGSSRTPRDTTDIPQP